MYKQKLYIHCAHVLQCTYLADQLIHVCTTLTRTKYRAHRAQQVGFALAGPCTGPKSGKGTTMLTLGAVAKYTSRSFTYICMRKFVGVQNTHTCAYTRKTHAVRIRS